MFMLIKFQFGKYINFSRTNIYDDKDTKVIDRFILLFQIRIQSFFLFDESSKNET